MENVNYTDLRQDLYNIANKVCDNHTTLTVSGPEAKPVVLMSLEDYNGIEETFYLLSSSENAKRLREALATDPSEYIYVDKLLE